MKPLRGISGRPWGLLVGGAVIALGCVAYALGQFDGFANYGLDVHFRHLSTIEADPRIVLIDINDHALRAVGDWPWPRRRYAQLVRTLGEIGAEAIVLDLVLSEPASPQPPGLGKHYDVDTELIELGDPSTQPITFDDDELRDAIAAAGNVYLAMFFRLSPPTVDPEAVLDAALDLIRREPAVGPERFSSLLSTAFPAIDDVFAGDAFHPQVRIAALLEEDFGLDVSAIARRMGESATDDLRTIEEHLPKAKLLVALQAARRFFVDRPAGTFRAFFELMLPGRDFHAITPDREDLIHAYRAQDAFRALADSSAAVPSTFSGHIPHGYDLTLPVEKFARAAKGIGFVSFEREEGGGVVREIPLVAEADGVLASQLGFLVATDMLGVDQSAIQYDQGRLILQKGDQTRHLRLNRQGQTLLNWHVPLGSARWQDSFDHIPVARVLEIALNAEAVAENKRHLALAMAELVELRHADTHAEYAEYVRLINRRLALRSGDSPRESQGTSEEMVRLDGEIGRIEEDAILWLRRIHGLWENTEPVDDEERVQRDRIRQLYAEFGEGQLAARLDTLNDNLTARTDDLLAELGPRINGKICLVGYTASGVADLVTSPVHSSMPGVMAHANILNMLLQNRPAVRASGWLNVLIILLGGITITTATAARSPLFSLGSLFVLVAVVLGVGGLVFRSFTYHIASMVAATNVCVAWACVTAYRQFTEERVRRQFQRALAQYTSPAVAARIADRASVRDLAPQPARVTCFFSDLQGFTPLSERLGAERTRLVLNPYLRTMSRVLVEHHAIINKFMGDGIFAFFNAPIWPCADHSEAACACALASLAALRELNREMCRAKPDLRLRELNRQSTILGDGEPLAMRIGISTGEVFVGDYGSDTKLDYTCIGDAVNLAARLEEANKAFGTAVLVDDACRRGAGERFTFRPLGCIEIAGKAQPVEVHELLGCAAFPAMDNTRRKE